jgi:cytochrome P450
MRLYPPAWAVGRQAVEPCRVGDRVDVPAGAVLLMSQWVLHRDTRYWPDPLAFDPSRFLGEHPDRPRYAYFPFGGGPRQCIGEAFAWTEGVLAIAALARRWRVQLLDSDRPLPLQATITLRPKNGLPVRVERREPVDENRARTRPVSSAERADV